jgi:hypothetical protein
VPFAFLTVNRVCMSGHAAVYTEVPGPGRSQPFQSTVRARPGRLRDLSVFYSESVLYGGFVWACRLLNSQKR